MKCLRCGYCCCFLDVVIISPSAIQSDGSVDFENEHNYQYKPTNVECPHLKWKDESAVCGIHHFPWFIETPCYSYTQIGLEDSPCRTGKYFKDNKVDMRERLNLLCSTKY
jgi:hypothetical protein